MTAVTPELELRAPQPGDVLTLEEAECVCFIDPWPGRYFLSEMFASGRFNRVLVGPDGVLAAYLFSAWQYLDLHVLKVATLPAYRREGLARRLMDLAESHAKEHQGESVTLEVRERNLPAIAMYGVLGYAGVGRRRGYYADGEDALIMTKRLGVRG